MNTFYQKDTLGFGDIKLLALITFIMSINTMPYIIFFSSFLTLVGMLVFNLRKIPFAPGILLSWIGVYLWLFI
jgi:prepilin signal peptidase PulO-like enzyme (type II secretory pathway)